MKPSAAKTKLHYAWIVTLGCHIMFFYGVGLTTGTFAIFLPALINELNLTNAEGSSIISVLSMTGLIFMLIAAKIFKRYGIRLTVFICGILIAIGNYGFSISNSLPGYYISAVTIGIGYGCCSTIPVCLLVEAWFRKRRGTAVGIAYAGSGVAVIFFSPMLMSIIVDFGLSKAFLFQSVCVAVLASATFLLISDAPEDKGIKPYGQNEYESQTGEKREATPTSIIFKGDFRTKRYYHMLLAIIALGAAVQPVVTHLPAFLISVGYMPGFAASLVSIYGFTMVLGKTMYGLVIDRLGGYGANFIIFPLWLITIAFSFVVGRGVLSAYIFAVLLGMGPALATVSLPIWAGDLFGKESYAAILTSIQVTLNLGSSIGIVLIRFLFDVTGEYNASFSLAFLFAATAFICVQRLYRSSDADKKM